MLFICMILWTNKHSTILTVLLKLKYHKILNTKSRIDYRD